MKGNNIKNKFCIPKKILKSWEEAFNSLPKPNKLVSVPQNIFKCDSKLYVTPETLDALLKVKDNLAPNEDLEIYSAYRDSDELFKLWNEGLIGEICGSNSLIEDLEKEFGNYVASPYHPSYPPHSRGDAVDVTLYFNDKKVKLENNPHEKNEWRFDFFENVDEEIHNNRKRLRKLMETGGFIPYDKEYWHFGLTPVWLEGSLKNV